MHQRGTMDVQRRAAAAPEVSLPAFEALALGEGRVVQLLFEAPLDLEMLPPSQHPSIPEHISVLIWDCPESPLGPARIAQVRVGCRTGILPRGFVVGAFCDNEGIASLLRDGWGFPMRAASIDVLVRLSRIDVSIALDGRPVLAGSLRDPVKVPGGELLVSGSVNLALVEGRARLIQADFTHRLETPEIGTASLDVFDAAALGDPRMLPRHPIVASMARGTMELRPVRYLIGATELAIDDTVEVKRPAVTP